MNASNASMEVSIRGGFSDRNGIKKENTTLQIEELDEKTRNAICNAITDIYNEFTKSMYDVSRFRIPFWKKIFSEAYHIVLEANERLYDSDRYLQTLINTIKTADYSDVLSLVEFVVALFNAENRRRINNEVETSSKLNSLFEKEYVGYRIVNGIVIPITDNMEIKSIEKAIASPYERVNGHLQSALRLMSNRNNPDYSNSIKESISAVEGMCNIIAGHSCTLKDGLKEVRNKGVYIHEALFIAFIKLYGYTNDETGIRHDGNLDGEKATFEEAQFMIVACSAFVNYLIGKNYKSSE